LARNNRSLFAFENIVFLTDRDLLCLLKEIDNVTLLQACKQCDDLVIQRISRQFSQLAREYFYDDFARIENTSPEEIADAQGRIGDTLNRLYFQGQLKDWVSNYAA